MILHSLKLTGAGAAVALSSGLPPLAGYSAGNPLQCKFVQLLTGANNAANVNVGGLEVTAPTVSPATSGTGFPLPPGFFGQLMPPIAELCDFYELSNIYVGMATGDVLYVLYGG